MHSLLDLQKKFSCAVLEQDVSYIEQDLVSSKVTSKGAFQIYLNTYNISLSELLENYFPAIWSLLGAECATGFAFKYSHLHPPEIQNFEDWPALFPQFLYEQSELQALPYLKDVATLEWLRSKSYTALNAISLSPHEITAQIKNITQGDVMITLDPTLILTHLTYAADQIIDTALDKNADDFELTLGDYYYMIYRKGMRPQIDRLSYDAYQLLNKLQTIPLNGALAECDLNESKEQIILSKLIQNNLIISLKEV